MPCIFPPCVKLTCTASGEAEAGADGVHPHPQSTFEAHYGGLLSFGEFLEAQGCVEVRLKDLLSEQIQTHPSGHLQGSTNLWPNDQGGLAKPLKGLPEATWDLWIRSAHGIGVPRR